MQHKIRLTLLILIAANVVIWAQGVSQTPYSQFGIGDLEYQGNMRQHGMGGVGVSMPNRFYSNLINPALLAYNRTHVIFDAGFYGQSDIIRSQTQSQRIVSGNVNYLSILFPISTRNWTISVGLNPYSNANTRFTNTRDSIASYKFPLGTYDSTDIKYHVISEGGLNQVFMSHGIKLPKGFSIGISINYIFGGIIRTTRIQPKLLGQSTQTQIVSKEQYRLLEFKPGIAYFKQLSEKYSLNIGATATFNTDIGSTRNLVNSIVREQRLAENSYVYVPIYADTLPLEIKKVSLPSQYKIGVSFDKSNHWNVALDYTFGDYRNYVGYERTNVFSNSSHRINIGAEYVPNYFVPDNSFKSQIQRYMYRIGGYYYLMPLQLNGVQIQEMAATIGLGMPFGKGGYTSLNLALMVGQKGTLDNGLVQENFVRFFVGLTINDRWFIRYKLD